MNAKDPQLVERFIALRARRTSYAAISAEIGVERTTLFRWSRTHAQRLANERAMEDEMFAETLHNSRRARLQKACALRDRVLQELDGRNLDQIPTDRLALLAYRLDKHIPQPADTIKFSEEFTEADLASGNVPPVLVSWEA
jgi:transposase-like protein